MCVETRRIWTSAKLKGCVRYAHAAQVACVEREVFHVSRTTTTTERVYLITSSSAKQVGPAQLLALNRGHWSIENCLHHVRDMAYDEDRCRARKGDAPRTPACLRNFAISMLRLRKTTNIKAALRDLAARPATILAMLRL